MPEIPVAAVRQTETTSRDVEAVARHATESSFERVVERTEMQHESLWNEAVAFTRAKSPASFEQWFSGVQYDGMTDGVVSLRARDEFVREWVDQHFLPTLVDYLRSQTGWSVQIAWSVGGDLPRPVAESAASGPRP